MARFVGLDVSQKLTSICVVDDAFRGRADQQQYDERQCLCRLDLGADGEQHDDQW